MMFGEMSLEFYVVKENITISQIECMIKKTMVTEISNLQSFLNFDKKISRRAAGAAGLVCHLANARLELPHFRELRRHDLGEKIEGIQSTSKL